MIVAILAQAGSTFDEADAIRRTDAYAKEAFPDLTSMFCRRRRSSRLGLAVDATNDSSKARSLTVNMSFSVLWRVFDGLMLNISRMGSMLMEAFTYESMPSMP